MRIEAIGIIATVSLLFGWNGASNQLTREETPYYESAETRFQKSSLPTNLTSRPMSDSSPNGGARTGETGSDFNSRAKADQGDTEIKP